LAPIGPLSERLPDAPLEAGLDSTVHSHVLCFAAEQARLTGQVVDLDNYCLRYFSSDSREKRKCLIYFNLVEFFSRQEAGTVASGMNSEIRVAEVE
jgi:hypothetical protein